MVSTLLGMHSKSSEQLLTLMISRRCCLMVSPFFSLESVMTINQQSFLVSNMCDEFMVCGGRRVWSINLLNRAVCSEESRVMFIEGVPTTALWDCFCCEAIEREEKLTIPASRIDIYLQEASLFCVASPLQVRMAPATEIVLCFSSPLCCQSLCQMQDGKWKKVEKMGARLQDTDDDNPYGYILP